MYLRIFGDGARWFRPAALATAAVIMIGVVSLLAVVTLRQNAAGLSGTDTTALVVTGNALVAVRDWTFLLGPSLMAALNSSDIAVNVQQGS